MRLWPFPGPRKEAHSPFCGPSSLIRRSCRTGTEARREHLDTGDEGWLKQTAWGSQEMLSPQESQASPWRVQAGPREDAQAGSSKASARSTRAARSLCGFRWRRLLLSVSPPHASRVALSTCVCAACVACACLCDQATYVSLTYLGGRGSALTVQAMGRAGVPVEEPSSDTPA